MHLKKKGMQIPGGVAGGMGNDRGVNDRIDSCIIITLLLETSR